MNSLKAAIEVSSAQVGASDLQIVLRITNQTPNTLPVLNPDMGVPSSSMNWPYSHATYQTAMLLSFNFLAITVMDEHGQEVAQQPIATWATPVLMPKVQLVPGQSMEVTIPIGELYSLQSGRTYDVTVVYGDAELKVRAHAVVRVA